MIENTYFLLATGHMNLLASTIARLMMVMQYMLTLVC